ncbi:MAG: TldD/PmbA family protein, partial [Sphingobacteriaceae bacterium]
MKRRDFIYLGGMGLGAATLPDLAAFGKPVSPDAEYYTIDTAVKKKLADVALNAARSKGATYADVRIGRYLNQSLITRENRVQNITNTESYGMGIRVIANGCWGFAATDKMDND